MKQRFQKSRNAGRSSTPRNTKAGSRARKAIAKFSRPQEEIPADRGARERQSRTQGSE